MALWMKALNQVMKREWINETRSAGRITGEKNLLRQIKEMCGGLRCLDMGGRMKSD